MMMTMTVALLQGRQPRRLRPAGDDDTAEDLWTNEMLIAVVSTVASAIVLGSAKMIWDRRPRVASVAAPVAHPIVLQSCHEPDGKNVVCLRGEEGGEQFAPAF
ncbi:unnamed protein product [Ectocarpus fasciculatus]